MLATILAFIRGEPMGKFDIYKDAAGEWRWRLKAANHQVIAVSGEGYTSQRNARRAVKTVKRVVRAA